METRLFTLYGTTMEECIEECKKRNYPVLEQLYDLDKEVEAVIEFRDYNLFEGRELTREKKQMSRATTLFFKDILDVKNGKKEENKLLSSYTMYYAVDEAIEKTGLNSFYYNRELWILACQDFLIRLGRNEGIKRDYTETLFEILDRRSGFNFTIGFKDSDVTDKMKEFYDGCTALGPDYLMGSIFTPFVFSKILVPYYFELQRFINDMPVADSMKLDCLKVGAY